MRFINEYINGELEINRKSKDYILNLLKERKYPVHSEIEGDGNYDYLTRLPIISLTLERIKDLESQCNNKRKELSYIMSKTDKDLWRIDLESLYKKLN